MAFEVSNPILGIAVESVSSGNAKGLGSLKAKTAGSLTWTAPGGTEGGAVAIANGEWKIVADGTDGDAFVVVKRTSASALAGTATITITSYKTVLERLEETDEAISKAKLMQASGIADVRVQRAQLETLQAIRNQEYREYLRQQGKAPAASTADFRGLM